MQPVMTLLYIAAGLLAFGAIVIVIGIVVYMREPKLGPQTTPTWTSVLITLFKKAAVEIINNPSPGMKLASAGMLFFYAGLLLLVGSIIPALADWISKIVSGGGGGTPTPSPTPTVSAT